MRIVIEVTEAERAALQSLQDLYHSTYSSVFRAWLKLTVDGTLPATKLRAALESARPVLNITVQAGTDLANKPKYAPDSWEAKLLGVQSDKDRTEQPTRRVKRK